MDNIIYLEPRAGNFERFTLRADGGALSVVDVGQVQLLTRRAVDGQIIELTNGTSVDVNDIIPSEMYVRLLSNSPGVSNIKLTLTEGGQTRDYLVTTVVGTILIDCDADRDGNVGVNEEGKANWTWGPSGRGAITIVDNDRDPLTGAPGALDEREPIVVRDTGLSSLPPGCELRLRTSPDGAMKFSVFRETPAGAVKVLGKAPSATIDKTVSSFSGINLSGETLLVAAHEYPGPFFEGPLIINLELIYLNAGSEIILGSNRVMMRAAPWIVTPNTQPAEKFIHVGWRLIIMSNSS